MGNSEDEELSMKEFFLNFLSKDIIENPDRLKPLSETQITEINRLTEEVIVHDNEAIPEDVSL